MQFENLKAIIDFAIEKEKEAAEFYDDVSEREPFAGSKEMLKEFAAQERKHQAMLEKFLTQGVDQNVAEYKLKWITDIKRSNYVVDMEYQEGMGYNELLMLAMKREEKALALYNKLEKEVEDAKSKKLFQVLSQEEAKHKLFLETKYDDYMANMGD
ncbi:MAG: ferritin family protein [Desulfobacterales bacterium]|uniref:Ferritin family protein n=1 Tax=Candidatus Desulfatibia profunda TaxID=2841695 RepID=A0A8J6NL39_9BACT|nr:ferritin family protein [Candidatus Desulfatibia profunda]MBL7181288.1 ferritin family protein [Desulfobacterales bacterium]MBU0699502.1 ferritin family protein [Pseudomonadota bacterium]